VRGFCAGPQYSISRAPGRLFSTLWPAPCPSHPALYPLAPSVDTKHWAAILKSSDTRKRSRFEFTSIFCSFALEHDLVTLINNAHFRHLRRLPSLITSASIV